MPPRGVVKCPPSWYQPSAPSQAEDHPDCHYVISAILTSSCLYVLQSVNDGDEIGPIDRVCLGMYHRPTARPRGPRLQIPGHTGAPNKQMQQV